MHHLTLLIDMVLRVAMVEGGLKLFLNGTDDLR